MRSTNALLILLSVAVATASLAAQKSAPSPAVVAFRVTDSSGTGVAGAAVRIVPAPDGAPPKIETNKKGEFALDLKPGGYALFVRSPGFTAFSTHFDVRETNDLQTVTAVLQVASGGGVEVFTTAKDSLTLLASPYHIPMTVSAADLKAMPHIEVTVHNPHANADESYSGVRLADLLAKMNAPLGSELHGEAVANYVVATGSDGYQAVLAIGEVDPTFHSGEIIVADTMNGKPLDEHSGPFKLVVSEDKRPARAVRNLTTIELRALH